MYAMRFVAAVSLLADRADFREKYRVFLVFLFEVM
jgi:hypothetical protein